MTLRRIEWLELLGTLCAGQMTVDDARAKTRAYAAMLADMPAEAFSRTSLEVVAAQCKWFPSYGEVREYLGAWWKENRPMRTALPAAGKPTDWDAMDDIWLRYWRKREAQNFYRPPYIWMADGMTYREHCAALVRQQAPRVWQYLQQQATSNVAAD